MRPIFKTANREQASPILHFSKRLLCVVSTKPTYLPNHECNLRPWRQVVTGHTDDLLSGIALAATICASALHVACGAASRAFRTRSPKAQRTTTQHRFMLLLGVNIQTHCTSMLMSVTCDACTFLTHLQRWQAGHMKHSRRA